MTAVLPPVSKGGQVVLREPGPVAMQARVVWALMLREIETRYGSFRAGYLWAFVEPLIHVLSFAFLVSLFSHGLALGTSMYTFVATAVVGFFLFRDLLERVEGSLVANRALLYFPIVKPLDVVWARAILDSATWLLVAIFCFSILAIFGQQALPHDILTVLAGLLAMALLGVGSGLVCAVVERFTLVWSKLLHAFLRPVYIASGVAFLPDSAPGMFRDVMGWLPTAHGIDWIRTGFYEGYESTFLSKTYLLCWGLATLLSGLVLERLTRRHSEVE